MTNKDQSWMISEARLNNAPNAKVMHCLPVRRNVVIADDVLDSPRSIVIEQAENRLYAAQYVLSEMVSALKYQDQTMIATTDEVYADGIK